MAWHIVALRAVCRAPLPPMMPGRRPALSVLLLLLASSVVLLPCAAAEEPTGAELPVDLVYANFTRYLLTVPTSDWVLMEFYAHWCPHCKHFRPNYELISQFFYRHNKVPRVVVARVDCADEGKLCSAFKVQGYPSLRLARPQAFAGMEVENTKEVKASQRTPKAIVNWIGDFINTTYEDSLWTEGSEDAVAAVGKQQNGGVGGSGGSTGAAGSTSGGSAGTTAQGGGGSTIGGYTRTSAHVAEPGIPLHTDPPVADLGDIEAATVLSTRFIREAGAMLRGAAKRTALHDWVTLLAQAHPSPRCRKGATAIAKRFESAWPPARANSPPDASLFKTPVCGNAVQPVEGQWQQCRGSLPSSRGFTCGMWLLFHSLAARVPDHVGGAMWMAGVRGYVGEFFGCRQCADHFMTLATTSSANAVRSRRDAVLWMWETHNKVNKRLVAEELQWGDRDPEYPKMQWPPKTMCERCSIQAGMSMGGQWYELMWDDEEVYHFLVAYYGGEEGPTAALRLQRQQAAARGGGRKIGMGARGDWSSDGSLSISSAPRGRWLPKLLVLAVVVGLLVRACSSPASPPSRRGVGGRGGDDGWAVGLSEAYGGGAARQRSNGGGGSGLGFGQMGGVLSAAAWAAPGAEKKM